MQPVESPAEPTHLKRRVSVKYLVGGAVIAAAIIYLVASAAQGASTYYLTIDELGRRQSSPHQVRVVGKVVGSSIVWHADDVMLEFQIADSSGMLAVRHHGPRPDMLRDGAEVVVEGRLQNGVFEAQTLVLKCPSKYEADKDG